MAKKNNHLDRFFNCEYGRVCFIYISIFTEKQDGMYLKQIEIRGFKSFADKTVLKLFPGMTAVVGPNGCGKE